MGFLSRIFGEPIETRDAASDVTWDFLKLNLASADGLPYVAPAASEGVAAIFSAISLISSAVASLPLMVYRKTSKGREPAESHPVQRIFAGAFSELQTAPEGIESIQASALLFGAGHAEIVRDGNGAPIELKTIPFGMISRVDLPNGKHAFDVSNRTGGTRRLLPSEIFSIYDRVDEAGIARSRLSRCAETVQGVVAAERYAKSIFGNSANISGIFSHPGKLSKEGRDRLLESLNKRFVGPDQGGKFAILQEGLAWTPIAAKPDESQALETRRFSVEQVARIFNVPPILLGDLSHANFANSVQLNQTFLTYSLMPWLKKWESRVLYSLFSESGRQQFEVEVDTDLLLRANQLERFQAYRIAREIGLYNANELRRFEMANPRSDAGGNEYFSPLNMSNPQERGPKDDD